MKELIEFIKQNYYARKLYKAIRYLFYVAKDPKATVNGSAHTCYINKKYLGKKFENSKYKLWLAKIMKNKYGMRFLRCEDSELKDYYLVTYYKNKN